MFSWKLLCYIECGGELSHGRAVLCKAERKGKVVERKLNLFDEGLLWFARVPDVLVNIYIFMGQTGLIDEISLYSVSSWQFGALNSRSRITCSTNVLHASSLRKLVNEN